MSTDKSIKLHGRIILDGKIEALTGLHIGGSPGALAIGGVDLPVLRNPLNQEPYIPGSSLKGKMRSLWEKAMGAAQNRPVGQVTIHACEKKEEYVECPVCQIYGTLGQSEAVFPTRIVVRDVPLDPKSLATARTDLPFSEVKWEATIDRITSAAVPRQIERVPAGAVFHKMQIVFNVYSEDDHIRFLDVLTALQLVEDDYLGGHGSRGSGRVEFIEMALTCKSSDNYATPNDPRTLTGLNDREGLLDWLRGEIPVTRGTATATPTEAS